MLRYLLLLLITGFTLHAFAEERVIDTVFNDAPESSPWLVHHERAVIHSSASVDGGAIGLLEEGDEVSGIVILNTETEEEWIKIKAGDSTGYVSTSVLTRVHPKNQTEGDIPIGEAMINRWWGIPISYEPSDLVPLPEQLTDGRNQMLRREAAEAAEEMLQAAKADGVDLIVVSAYRSGPVQKRIYDRNITRAGRSQRFSAPPGHSEHQLGLTIDVADRARKHTFSRTFHQVPEGAWIAENGPRFGFHQSYTPENTDTTGYIAEPWHWRYKGKPQ